MSFLKEKGRGGTTFLLIAKGYFLEKKLLRKCLQGMYYLETKGNLIIRTLSWSTKYIFLSILTIKK